MAYCKDNLAIVQIQFNLSFYSSLETFIACTGNNSLLQRFELQRFDLHSKWVKISSFNTVCVNFKQNKKGWVLRAFYARLITYDFLFIGRILLKFLDSIHRLLEDLKQKAKDREKTKNLQYAYFKTFVDLDIPHNKRFGRLLN
jgi:hypothetical protein